MKCTKAIIPVAGYGTRRLPITKSIEKCMLPVLNRPVIDYVVEDCIKAGITDIYFVVSPGATQIRSYYQRNQQLEDYLVANGKQQMLDVVKPLTDVNFHFIEQDVTAGAPYGTTIPVWLCRDIIEADEQFLVLMGDDFIYNPDGSSETKRLIENVTSSNANAGMIGVAIPQEDVSRYGVIALQDNSQLFDSIQEKPEVSEAKSNLINVSKYIFGADFMDYIKKGVDAGPSAGGEYFITDPLNSYVQDGKTIQVVESKGKYLDSGTVENWLTANNFVAENPVT